MKRDWICITGAIIGLLTGICRGIGGMTLLSGSLTETMIGVGLIIVSLWLIFSALAVMIMPNTNRKIWLTVGIIMFWIDGIINGFMLFGSPQLSGQIVNMAIVLVVLGCLWLKRTKCA